MTTDRWCDRRCRCTSLGPFALIGPAGWIISTVAGPQASDNFVANVMTLFGMPVLFAPLAILFYALVSLVRWPTPKHR
ncbi:hypothetical protein QA640_21760 [Bradyrhizobium sp. CB82]|uniref:hypothetical protein n=1 Tax=Bradyrhizobium sp. CB82 TaxID=3039159 RepID=UPI0024B0FF95|nr:hypothetical protein [Bradyrhizobium sp. CB82]WFU44850.1 hypothetical protein QA640_21760 [Bradyrhizobium sp. CB82]